MASDNRRTKRYLLRKGERKDLNQVYADNKGAEYSYKFIARIASFYNIIAGCLKNGFPVAVPALHYMAWAFYPFFFINKNIRVKDPVPILNHERIHIRQQREIHIFISLPLLVACLVFEQYDLIPLLIFIPTFLYLLDFVRVWIKYKTRFSEVRSLTCFEAEAISRATNTNYLFHRKPFAFIAYMGIKIFNNYGQDLHRKR